MGTVKTATSFDNGLSRQCSGTNRSGNQCKRPPVPGGRVCQIHGGATPIAIHAARLRLLALVEPALETLFEAMEQTDHWPSAVKAAEILMDRAGFGPRSTLVIEDDRKDLAPLTTDELLARTELIQTRLREAIAKQKSELRLIPRADDVVS